MRRLVILAAALALSGCASLSSCPSGLHHARIAELFFGRNIGDHEGVSDADWQNFVDTEIAPRFPDGFTVSDAKGQWRGPDGTAVQERSKRLVVIDGDEGRLTAIRTAYKSRFHQDAVLETEQSACAGF